MPPMPLRKRATRLGFQVSLENDSAPFVGELNDDVTFPRPTVGGMRASPSIVCEAFSRNSRSSRRDDGTSCGEDGLML